MKLWKTLEDEEETDDTPSPKQHATSEESTAYDFTLENDDTIDIGDDMGIIIMEIRGDKVRLGIVAPVEIPIHRMEVYIAIQKEREEDTLNTIPGLPKQDQKVREAKKGRESEEKVDETQKVAQGHRSQVQQATAKKTTESIREETRLNLRERLTKIVKILKDGAMFAKKSESIAEGRDPLIRDVIDLVEKHCKKKKRVEKESISPEKMSAIRWAIDTTCDHTSRLVDTALAQLGASHVELRFSTLSLLKCKINKLFARRIFNKGWKEDNGGQMTLTVEPWLMKIRATLQLRLNKCHRKSEKTNRRYPEQKDRSTNKSEDSAITSR